MTEAKVTLYEVLGVTPEATEEEIKKAFRQRATQCHPDKVGEAGTEEFIQVNLAYQVLIDPVRRARYDACGDTGEDSGKSEFTEVEQNLLVLFYNYMSSRLGEWNHDSNSVAGAIKVNLKETIRAFESKLHGIEKKLCVLEGMPVYHRKERTQQNLMELARAQTISVLKEDQKETEKGLTMAKEIYDLLTDFLEPEQPRLEKEPTSTFRGATLGPMAMGNGKFVLGSIS